MPHPAVSHAIRYRQIATILARHGLGSFVDLLGLDRYAPFHQGLFGNLRGTEAATRPEHLRLALEELGATFIKLGQILSTRPDILPPEYIGELVKLQDAVPPVASEQIQAVIVRELGRPIDEAFATFDQEPLAAASIGQAHAATLPDGTAVVVKVRRPGVVEQVEADLEIMKNLAVRASRRWEQARHYEIVGLIDEFAETLRAELDYLREARNAERFAANFADDATVRIPRIFWETTTSRVLTLERMRGVKIGDTPALAAAGIDRRALAERAAHITLKMIFEDGFFHADPHPGNLFIEADGTIALIDFGMVGIVDGRTREQLAGLLMAITSQDVDRLVDAYLELGFTRGQVDRARLGQDLGHLVGRYYGQPLGAILLGPLITDALLVVQRHHLQLPPTLALLLKTMVMSEGLAAALNPDFHLTAILAPYARRLIIQRYTPGRMLRRLGRASLDAEALLVESPREVRRLLRQLERGNLVVATRPEGFEPILRDMERLANRLVLGLLAAAFITGLAVLTAGYHPPGWERWIGPFFVFGFVSAALLGIYLIGSILRSGHR